MRLTASRVVLAVRDLKASTAFYTGVLGCESVGPDPSSGWSLLAKDALTVMLGECPDVTPASKIGDHSYVAYVEVDDVDALHAEIKKRGQRRAGTIELSAPTSQPWGMRECCLRTPDGHRIMFGQDLS